MYAFLHQCCCLALIYKPREREQRQDRGGGKGRRRLSYTMGVPDLVNSLNLQLHIV